MNQKLKSYLCTFACLVALLIGPTGNAHAQDEDMHPDTAQFDEIRNLGSLSCRDILLTSGNARENLVLVFHAYLLGEAKQLDFNALELAEATDRFLNACIDKPDAQALQTMRDSIE